jgi:hypothetical protein
MNLDPSSQSLNRAKRPIWITLLCLFFLVLGILGCLRVWEAVQQWSLLVELKAWPGPLYIVAGGAVWGGLGLLASVALAIGFAWGPILAEAAILIVLASYWVDRTLSVQVGASFVNWPFMLVVSVAGIVYTFWAVSRPASRKFFRKQNQNLY